MSAQTNFPQRATKGADPRASGTEGSSCAGIPAVVKAKKNSKAHRYMQGYCSDTERWVGSLAAAAHALSGLHAQVPYRSRGW